MSSTNTSDLALILGFILLPMIMVNAIFVFMISLLGGMWWLYIVLIVLDGAVIWWILTKTEVGQVILSYFKK